MQKVDNKFSKVDNALIPKYFEKHIDGEFFIYVAHKPIDIYLNGIVFYDIIYIEADTERGSMFLYKDIHVNTKNKEPMIEPVAFALADLITAIDAGK